LSASEKSRFMAALPAAACAYSVFCARTIDSRRDDWKMTLTST
jgi:hypothetical protein